MPWSDRTPLQRSVSERRFGEKICSHHLRLTKREDVDSVFACPNSLLVSLIQDDGLAYSAYSPQIHLSQANHTNTTHKRYLPDAVLRPYPQKTLFINEGSYFNLCFGLPHTGGVEGHGGGSSPSWSLPMRCFLLHETLHSTRFLFTPSILWCINGCLQTHLGKHKISS